MPVYHIVDPSPLELHCRQIFQGDTLSGAGAAAIDGVLDRRSLVFLAGVVYSLTGAAHAIACTPWLSEHRLRPSSQIDKGRPTWLRLQRFTGHSNLQTHWRRLTRWK